MRRVILMALSFGLVTTVTSAQTTNTNQEPGTKTKSKTEVKKDQETKATDKSVNKEESETKNKNMNKSQEGKTKTKTETKSETKKDQGTRSNDVKYKSSTSVKGWDKSKDNTWMGIDNYHYRLGTSGQLEKSQDGQAWRLSQSGRWQDDEGTYYRLKDKKLESSKDGSTWDACAQNSWRGRDNVWYRYNDIDNSIYSTGTQNSSQQGLQNNQDSLRIKGGMNDNRKDVAPSRHMERRTPMDSSNLDNRNVVPNNLNNVDTANFNDQTPRMEQRRDLDTNREIFNQQDESMKNRNMEVQDPNDLRNREQPNNGKLNNYNDKTSPK
jgi:hypothetical protein